MSSVNTKKIAQNTIFLYVRMLLILMVSLYTSRVVLQVLGVEDYGIYNLCAGFVTFLTFISNALVSAMQRYFNVALGRKDILYYNAVFSMSINVLIVFSTIIIILGETVGLWFVMNYLNIPANRYDATLWVYHISLLTFVINVLRTPYHASIIAHERMSFYAYFSFIEVLLRLGVVFLLRWLPGDNLVLYAILYMVVILLVNIAYMVYCKIQFSECRYRYNRNSALLKELIGFSSWTLLGQASIVIKNQGEAIFINRFFSVVANAAMGVASQVTAALEMFVSNFQTAFTPQLIQSYASGDFSNHKLLLYRASRFSYYLLLIMMLPICFNIDFILNIWLVNVPDYAGNFIVFILVSYLFNALSTPFMTSISATGKIKHYQISVTLIFLSGLVFVYLVTYFSPYPYYVSIVSIFIQIALLISRYRYASKHLSISGAEFFNEVLRPVIVVTLFAIILPVLFVLVLPQYGLLGVILVIMLEVVYTLIIIYVFGMNYSERRFVKDFMRKLLRRPS